jgi:hypothetical protein
VLQKYQPLVLQFGLAVLPALGAAVAAHWTQSAIVGFIIATLSAFLVWLAPEMPDSQYVKLGVSWALAAAQALVQILPAGGVQAVTVEQWVMIGASAFAALSVTAPAAAAAVKGSAAVQT